jgi:hypothetical protein
MARRRSDQRGAKGYHDRRVNVRYPIQRFLIVCEGEKTEPEYFRRLRADHRLNAEVTILGLGVDPSQLVKEARSERRQGDFDQVWCVFDRDSWPTQNFNEAFAQAKRLNVRIAYSNEAFELWYLLHFHYYDTGIPRRQYCQMLDDLLGHPYKKNDPQTYAALRSGQDDALRNARTLLAQYDPLDPANDNPSTTVHLLVEALLHFAR